MSDLGPHPDPTPAVPLPALYIALVSGGCDPELAMTACREVAELRRPPVPSFTNSFLSLQALLMALCMMAFAAAIGFVLGRAVT